MANPGNVRALTARFEAMFVVRENPLFETAKPPEQVLPKTDSMSCAGKVAVSVLSVNNNAATPEGSDSDEDAGDDEVMQKMQDLEMENEELSTEKAELEARIESMEIELESLRKYASDDRHAEMQTEIARLKKALKTSVLGGKMLNRTASVLYDDTVALEQRVAEMQTEIDGLRTDAECLKKENDGLRMAPPSYVIDDDWDEDTWEEFDAFMKKNRNDGSTSFAEYYERTTQQFMSSKGLN